MPDSERFGLSHHSGPVTARVRPGTPGLAPLGYALLGLGLYGVTRAIEGAIVGAILSNIPASRADADTWYLGAGIAAGAGVALSGLGTWLVSRGRTTFELVPVPPPSR